MAIPSGSGTEVLKHISNRTLTNSWTTILTGVTNHIYTILSVIATETGSNAELLNIGVADDGSNTNLHYITNMASIPANGTFVWNDKFVISGAKYLRMALDSSGDVDIWVSYIDQDWT